MNFSSRRYNAVPNLQRGPSAFGRILPQLAHTVQPRCVCGAGIHSMIHAAGCKVQFMLSGTEAPRNPRPKELILPPGIKPRRRKRRTAKRGEVRPWPKSYRFTLQFSFSRPVNLALWKLIKAPPGWKKNPTSGNGQHKYRGVRFRCDDLKHDLTPEAVEELRARLSLILEEVF